MLTMAYPFRAWNRMQLTFGELVDEFKRLIGRFPDKRTGRNTIYRIEDAVLGEFSVFFT